MDFDDLDNEEEVAKQVQDEKKAADKAAAEAAAAKRREDAERIAAERKEAAKEAAPPAKAAAPSPAPAPAPVEEEEELWDVIGGVDKGGIMVREGESTSSTQKPDRLSTGARVVQLELKGDRLHYKLKTGTGPEEGWVSIKLTGKDLVIPVVGENGPKRRPPTWKVVKQPEISYQEMKEIANKSDPGDYYGMKFPYTKDQIVEMGPEWLTQAFHKSGVLPRDNAVTKITDAKEFVGGGAGLKCTFSVEYKKDAPYLHKKLFAKLPHKPGGSDRYYVSCMWNHDRPEIVFNIFLQESVPFRVPKFYFGDISAATTNFVLITESLPWAEKGKKEFEPGEIEPAYDKYKDWELPDGGPMYYTACCRALGKMAGYHKMKKLHPKVDEMFPMPEAVAEMPHLPPLDDLARKQNSAKADQLIRFVSETARAVFPEEIRDPMFLSKWKEELMEIADYQMEIGCFLSGAGTSNPHDYVGLTHNNLQIDNAFFWRNEKNEVEVGLLDWGVLACGPLAGAVQGCISGASVEVLLEHRDSFLEAFASSYEENGGPSLDRERFKLMSQMLMIQWSLTVISNVAQVLKFTKAQEWQEIKDWMDPRLIDRFQTRAHTTQFKESLQLWQKWGLYTVFRKWRADMGLPPKR